jgi:transposase
VIRAKIVLLAADGKGTVEIARTVGVARQLALKWLHRFVLERMAGLVDRPGRGRPRRLDARATGRGGTRSSHRRG